MKPFVSTPEDRHERSGKINFLFKNKTRFDQKSERVFFSLSINNFLFYWLSPFTFLTFRTRLALEIISTMLPSGINVSDVAFHKVP